jgi:hypothetical protein
VRGHARRPPRPARTSNGKQQKTLAGPTLVSWKARKGARLRPVPQGKYGIVRITRGRYAGHLGFYDDDEVMGTSIVYPWGSTPAGYVVVRHSSLAEATPAEARLWDEVNENPFARRNVRRHFEKLRSDD